MPNFSIWFSKWSQKDRRMIKSFVFHIIGWLNLRRSDHHLFLTSSYAWSPLWLKTKNSLKKKKTLGLWLWSQLFLLRLVQVRSGQVRPSFYYIQWPLAVELRLTGPGQHWCVYVVYLLPVTTRCCSCCSIARSLPFSGIAISERERKWSSWRLRAIRRTSSIFQLPGREGGRERGEAGRQSGRRHHQLECEGSGSLH